VWMTSRIRKQETPAFCRKGSITRPRSSFRWRRRGRQSTVYDPKSKQLTHIDTCFTDPPPDLREDKNNTLWLSGGGARQPVIGWINTKKFLETGDAAASQGWTAYCSTPTATASATTMSSPTNRSIPQRTSVSSRHVWHRWSIQRRLDLGLVLAMPGGVSRIIPGDNPPATALAEYYEVPTTIRARPIAASVARRRATSIATA